MLADAEGKLKCEYVKDYVVFDLETTGISSAYDEVVEISAVKVINEMVVDEFTTLVNPHRLIPAAANFLMISMPPAFFPASPPTAR